MKLLSSCLLILLSNVAMAQQVNVFISFQQSSVDSCSLRLGLYHLKEFEPLYTKSVQGKTCQFSFQLAKPVAAELLFNQQIVQLWIEPNDSMEILIDSDSISPVVSLKGKGAVNNAFYRGFHKTFQTHFDKDSIQSRMLKEGIDAFENLIFKDRKEQQDYFTRYRQKDSLSANVVQFVKSTIRYQYLYQLLAYPIIRANQNKDLTVTAVPAVFLEDITPDLAEHDEALDAEAYRLFLYYYVVYNTSRLNGFEKFTDLSTSMEQKMSFARQNLRGQSAIYFSASFLNENAATVLPATVREMYEGLSKQEGKGVYTKLLKEKCTRRIKAKGESTAKGTEGSKEESKTNAAVKITGLNGKQFSLEEFKGKVVYIDFWASWCGPCRMQFPYSKELHEKLSPAQKKQIVFLYISIDKTEEIWKKAIEMNGLGDFTNGLVPGDWGSEIIKHFGISSIPRYMLMDKKGRIVDMDAKRPSDEKIKEDILRLLGE